MRTDKATKSGMVRGIILSVAALIVAQTLALTVSEILAKIGLNAAICNMIAGLLYVGLAWMGAKLLCKKILKISMTGMRMPHIQMKEIWIVSAVLMPLCVVFFSVLSGGNWVKNTFDLGTEAAIITSAVFYYGIGAEMLTKVQYSILFWRISRLF